MQDEFESVQVSSEALQQDYSQLEQDYSALLADKEKLEQEYLEVRCHLNMSAFVTPQGVGS